MVPIILTPKMGIRLRFRVGNRRCIYDAVTNHILELPKDLYDLLPKWERLGAYSKNTELRTSKNSKSYAELRNACRDGLLSNEFPLLINPVEHRSLPEVLEQLEQNVSAMSFSVTERCNLRCTYCNYTENIGSRRTHSEKDMSLEIAKKGLAYLCKCIAGDQDRKPIVGFYGGEPLLVFHRVKAVVELAHTFFSPQSVGFNLTTNATIMNREIARFLADNEFYLLVSLDGPQFKHDCYRKYATGMGSYSGVMRSLSIINEEAPDYFDRNVAVNMTVAPPLELEALSEFISTELPVPLERCNITLVNASETNFLKNHPYSLKDVKSFETLSKRAEDCFVSGKWDNDPLAWLFFRQSLRKIVFRSGVNLSSKPYVPTGQCLPGGYKLYVDANGFMHLCERIDESAAIGHVDTGIDPSLVTKVLGPFYEDALETCKNCYGLRLCGVCLATTISKGKFSKDKKKETCDAALRRLRKELVSCTRILERAPTAFDSLSPPVPQKSFTIALDLIEK
jgi:uncharacterized protein